MPDLRDLLIQELEAPATCRRGEGFADNLDLSDPGMIRGRAVPYGKWIELSGGLVEFYEPTVFRKTDPSRVKVCLNHGSLPIGRTIKLEEREDGLYFEGQISASDDIPEARQARAMLADDLMDELSIGFAKVRDGTEIQTRSDGVTMWRHHRARLMEISLVPWGAMGRDATLTRARFTAFDPDAPTKAAELDARRQEARQWLERFHARGRCMIAPATSQPD